MYRYWRLSFLSPVVQVYLLAFRIALYLTGLLLLLAGLGLSCLGGTACSGCLLVLCLLDHGADRIDGEDDGENDQDSCDDRTADIPEGICSGTAGEVSQMKTIGM